MYAFNHFLEIILMLQELNFKITIKCIRNVTFKCLTT